MSDTPDLWEVQELPDRIAVEVHACTVPILVLVQGDKTIRTELTRVKALVAA
jgi:hypothetical protein